MTELPAALADRTGHPYVVRLYAATDRVPLEQMYLDFQPKRAAQGLPPADCESIARWLDRILVDGTHLVVEVDGVVRGHAMLLPMSAERAELANFLHQSVRFRGIGTQLNRIVLSLARDQHFHRVWLCVEPGNRPAVRSYERVGFKRRAGELWSPEVEMEVVLREEA